MKRQWKSGLESPAKIPLSSLKQETKPEEEEEEEVNDDDMERLTVVNPPSLVDEDDISDRKSFMTSDE